MRLGLGMAALVLMCAPAAALAAQPSDADFRREVLQRLERIERLLAAQSGGTSNGNSVQAATNIVCGSSDCVSNARNYCRNVGYERGLPAQIGRNEYGTAILRRVTCSN